MAVWSHHPDYDKQAKRWKRARDAVSGQDTVHAAGEAYLPRLKDQDEDDYASYKKRATWYGASYQVTSGLVGMLFRKPPRMQLPAGVKDFTDDINLAGMPLSVLAQEVTEEIMTVGRVGLLVDHPPSIDLDGKPITVAQAQAANLRPTIQLYVTEKIINWKYRRVKNVWALCLVVLEEVLLTPKDEFVDTAEIRWRVLDLDERDLYRQRVYRKKVVKGVVIEDQFEQVGQDVFPTIDGKELTAIPFFCIGVDDVDLCPEEPPLIDLYDLNFAHYRVSADYEHGCHFTGLPTPVISGYTPEASEDGAAPAKLYVGSAHAWVFPDPQAQARYLEFHGTGLVALEKNLDRKEMQMAVVGSRMLVADNKGRSNESATAVTVHRTGESSRLSSIAFAVSTAFERALKVFCAWAGASGDVEYQLNRDFMPVIMDANTLTALVAALAAKTISFDTFWDMLQRGDVAPLDITADAEMKKIAADPDIIGQPPAPKGKEPAPEKKAEQGGGSA